MFISHHEGISEILESEKVRKLEKLLIPWFYFLLLEENVVFWPTYKCANFHSQISLPFCLIEHMSRWISVHCNMRSIKQICGEIGVEKFMWHWWQLRAFMRANFNSWLFTGSIFCILILFSPIFQSTGFTATF